MTAEILPPTPAHLTRAVAALARGELVAIPTETVYGLAGLALDPLALARIFAAISADRLGSGIAKSMARPCACLLSASND